MSRRIQGRAFGQKNFCILFQRCLQGNPLGLIFLFRFIGIQLSFSRDRICDTEKVVGNPFPKYQRCCLSFFSCTTPHFRREAGRTRYPVSSRTSRRTASSRLSPCSTPPPGNLYSPDLVETNRYRVPLFAGWPVQRFCEKQIHPVYNSLHQ